MPEQMNEQQARDALMDAMVEEKNALKRWGKAHDAMIASRKKRQDAEATHHKMLDVSADGPK